MGIKREDQEPQDAIYSGAVTGRGSEKAKIHRVFHDIPEKCT